MTRSSWKGTITSRRTRSGRNSFAQSNRHTHCPWKGEANYYDIAVDGVLNEGAAWYYPEPKEAAANIKGRVAFWKSVVVD